MALVPIAVGEPRISTLYGMMHATPTLELGFGSVSLRAGTMFVVVAKAESQRYRYKVVKILLVDGRCGWVQDDWIYACTKRLER